MPTTIGFLATGNEVCDGDIVNTNTPQLAQLFIDHGWQIGHTLCVADDEAEILDGLSYLAARHDIIITTGGLGPTKDDITRNALAIFTDQDLTFNPSSWQRIRDRFEQLQLPLTKNNMQQAYFPEEAIVLSNTRGSADSCYLDHHNKLFFMLPGPPKECLGVMHDHVLDILEAQPNLVKTDLILLKWYLLGVSEAHVATQMEALLADIDCKTGYRAAYPYLEFKVWITDPNQQSDVQLLIDKALASYCLMPTLQMASVQAREYILQHQLSVQITDQATCGLLQTCLITPHTHRFIQFLAGPPSSVDDNSVQVHVSGLSEFWQAYEQGEDDTPHLAQETSLSVTLTYQQKTQSLEKVFPIRHMTLPTYVAEWVCYALVQWL